MWAPFYSKLSMIHNSRKRRRNTRNQQQFLQMNGLLTDPVTEKEGGEHIVTSSGVRIGHSSLQGFRPSNEDAHLIYEIIEGHTITAIFDGHAGSYAAEFVSANLARVLAMTPAWRKYVEKMEDVELIRDALVQTYEELDEELMMTEQMQSGFDMSGCTAVTVMITPTHIVCASVGDSRCVIGTVDGEAISLSEDHKPENFDERKRIEEAGGFVFMNRVNGELAMSRALGDFQYKINDRKDFSQQMVICVPDVEIHERTSRDDIVIVACDGVWDVMSNKEAVLEVRKIFREKAAEVDDGDEREVVVNERKTADLIGPLEERVAEDFIDQALDIGSMDNISAIVIKLNKGVL